MDVNGTLSLDIQTEASDPLVTGMMNLCNVASPPGFKMEPGPGSAISRAPVFRCRFCSWGSGRESLVAIHERTCQQEQARFKAQGVSAEEVKAIVVETMKPILTEFARELKAALIPAAPVPVTPERKKRGRPPKNGSPSSRS